VWVLYKVGLDKQVAVLGEGREESRCTICAIYVKGDQPGFQVCLEAMQVRAILRKRAIAAPPRAVPRRMGSEKSRSIGRRISC
jgi:hypothetical protein